MPKRKDKLHQWRGYYYTAEAGHFGGFFYWQDETSLPDTAHKDGYRVPEMGNVYGPFPTFGEAVLDALDYFRAEIRHAKLAIGEIRAWRKHHVEH